MQDDYEFMQLLSNVKGQDVLHLIAEHLVEISEVKPIELISEIEGLN